MGQKFQLEGFDEFEAQLKDIAKGYRADLVVRQTLIKAAKKALEPALANIKGLAPYDDKNTSGIHLRETAKIDARIPNERDKNSDFYREGDVAWGMVSVKKSAVSLSQEFGNARTVAQPYLRNGFETAIPQILSILKSELAEIIPNYMIKLRRRKIK